MKKKSILYYLDQYRKETVIAPLFKMLEAVFELFVPLVVASIIDHGIGQKDTPYVIIMCGLLLLLAAIGLSCSITAQYFSAKAAVGAGTKMRQELFAHAMGFDFTTMDKIGAPALVTRITSDINNVQSGINMTLRLFLRSPCIVLGSAIMAFTIHFDMALIFVKAVIGLFIVIFGIMILSRPLFGRVQAGLDKIFGMTRENLEGFRVIRAFSLEEKERRAFHQENKALTSIQKLAANVSALTSPLTLVLINLAIIWLIYSGAVRVEAGSLSVGQVIALYNYMGQILIELIKLTNLIMIMTRAMASYQRVVEVRDGLPGGSSKGESLKEDDLKGDALSGSNASQASRERVSSRSPSPAGSEPSGNMMKDPSRSSYASVPESSSDMVPDESCIPAVEFSDVSYTYEGSSEPALSHISFKAMPGETIGIIGGTGSGKSTLANLIPGFYQAGEGRVNLFGRDIAQMSREERLGLTSVVPQNVQLFSGTIRSNLMIGAPIQPVYRPGPGSGMDSKESRSGPASDSVESRSGAAADSEAHRFDPASDSAESRSGMAADNETRQSGVAMDDRLKQALDIAQAAEFVNRLPKGIDEPVLQGGKNYSGGQRQRLTIARAMMKNAPILILDDSSSALDYATDRKLREALNDLPWNPAVFIISQRTSSIMHADQILVLDNGRMEGSGTHDTLLKECRVYREIYESQNRQER